MSQGKTHSDNRPPMRSTARTSFSSWFRNSILTSNTAPGDDGNARNSDTNTVNADVGGSSSAIIATHPSTSGNSLPQPKQHSSNCRNDNWIMHPQNIDEVMLCFYNGTTSCASHKPSEFLEYEDEQQEYDWLLDGEWEGEGAPQDCHSLHDPPSADSNRAAMHLALEDLSIEDDSQQLDSRMPSLVQQQQRFKRQFQRKQLQSPKLFINSSLVKLLPLTDAESNKTPLHKFARTSQLHMLQELERLQETLGVLVALEDESSLLSSHGNNDAAIPRIIQCFPNTNDDEYDHIAAKPSSPFTLNSDETLPLHFYYPGYDPVGHLLQTLPRLSTKKRCFVATADDFITQILSHADVCQTMIKVELNSLISSRKADIQQGIQQLQTIDREIGTCLLYWNQARHYIDSARRQAFLQESLMLIQNSILRTKYRNILKVLTECKDVITLEQQLTSLVTLRNDVHNDTINPQWRPHSLEEYQRFLSMAKELKARIFHSEYGLSSLHCLSPMRCRVSQILTASIGTLLFDELNQVLSISCRTNQFPNEQYSTLLQVYLRVISDSPSCDQIDSWSLGILKSLTNEADHCLLRALPLIATTVQEEGGKPISGLPSSFHQLCIELTNTLHSYYMIEQWHKSPFDTRNADIKFLHREGCNDKVDVFINEISKETPNALDPSSYPEFCCTEDSKRLNDIKRELARHRYLLWNHCEPLFEQLIDEHLSQDSKRNLSSLSLPSLRYLMQLENLMEFVVQDFVGLTLPASDFDPESFFRGIRTKIRHLCINHLSFFHRESVDVLRKMLQDETWQLMSVDNSVASPPNFYGLREQSVATAGTAHLEQFQSIFSQSHDDVLPGGSFFNFHLNGNLFNQIGNYHTLEATRYSTSYFDLIFQDLHNAVKHATSLHNGKSQNNFGGTKAAFNGLAHTTVKYIQLIKTLPLIADDVAASLTSLFDLYFVFVLRLCARNEGNEKVLLGFSSQTASEMIPQAELSPHLRSSSSSSIKHSKTKPSRTAALSPAREPEKPKLSRDLVPKTLEARIASATPSNSKQFQNVRHFVKGAQNRLKSYDIATNVEYFSDQDLHDVSLLFNVFLRQYCAAKSCWYVATLLECASQLACSDALHSYSTTVASMVSTFVNATTQMAAVQAVGGERIVREIIRVGRGWEEAKLVDGSSAYIDELSHRCSLLWANLSFLENFSLATCAWESIISSAFISLLEGFSLVFVCSTEGRALMSMDLASFASGISPRAVKSNLEGVDYQCPPPLITSLTRGMQYVDAVVKAFYFGERDLIKWIEENRASYRLEHCSGLIVSSIGGRRSVSYVNEILESIKLYYQSTDGRNET